VQTKLEIIESYICVQNVSLLLKIQYCVTLLIALKEQGQEDYLNTYTKATPCQDVETCS
jgi:hypothetical protein